MFFLGIALRAFFATLFNKEKAKAVAAVLRGDAVDRPLPPPATPSEPQRPAPAAKPSRSEALTLLAALQREARFVDLVKEPLADYADAQVGAAARDVLRDCATVLDRFFALEPLAEVPEGSQLELPTPYDAHRYRLRGELAAENVVRGTLVHHGWLAKRCELPQWSGAADAILVVAPAELEVAQGS